MNHLLTETEMDWCENIVYCYKAEPLIKFIYTGNRIKDGCYGIAMYPLFDHFIFLCIVVNTVTLSMDRYPIDYDFYMNLEITNNVCTFIFVGEMIIKLMGLGFRGYLADSMN